MVSFRVNVGRSQGVLPPQIIGMINKATDSGDIHIGRITIDSDSSDVQVDSDMADRVEEALSGYTYRGVEIHVERVADKRPPAGKRSGPSRTYRKGRPQSGKAKWKGSKRGR